MADRAAHLSAVVKEQFRAARQEKIAATITKPPAIASGDGRSCSSAIAAIVEGSGPVKSSPSFGFPAGTTAPS